MNKLIAILIVMIIALIFTMAVKTLAWVILIIIITIAIILIIKSGKRHKKINGYSHPEINKKIDRSV